MTELDRLKKLKEKFWEKWKFGIYGIFMGKPISGYVDIAKQQMLAEIDDLIEEAKIKIINNPIEAIPYIGKSVKRALTERKEATDGKDD